jgi:hypothetical protein
MQFGAEDGPISLPLLKHSEERNQLKSQFSSWKWPNGESKHI